MGRIVKAVFFLLVVLVAGVGIFGSKEPAGLQQTSDTGAIGADIPAYLAAREARFDDIIPGVEKRIIWAGQAGEKTPVSVVYIHGFSATSEEIRPVPERVAKGLGANLHFTRLTGHGRGSAAMAEATVADWINDIAEALEVGRRIGEKVVVIATSTGGTLAAAAALDPDLSRQVSAIIFVSPNFEVNNPLAFLLTWPEARLWAPYVGGQTQSSTPRNKLHGEYWTTTYPTVATLPMAAVVEAVADLDFSAVKIPALFYYSLEDQVVKPGATQIFAEGWGGPKKTVTVTMTPQDDIYSHIIAGDIVSPNQTDGAVEGMLGWLDGLGGL